MTPFEYVAAAHTLILTFAAARLLAGVANALQPQRLYWVHLSRLALAITFCLASFWVFWAYREVEWTLLRLIALLAAPGLIYIFCSVLVPVESSAVTSWQDYFFAVRRRLFCSGIVMIVSVLFSNQVLAGVGALHASQLPLYVLLTVFTVGLASDRPTVHRWLALAPPLVVVGVVLVIGRPDWTSP